MQTTDNTFWREVLPFIIGCILAGLIFAFLSSESYHKWRFMQTCNHPDYVCESLWEQGRE